MGPNPNADTVLVETDEVPHDDDDDNANEDSPTTKNKTPAAAAAATAKTPGGATAASSAAARRSVRGNAGDEPDTLQVNYIDRLGDAKVSDEAYFVQHCTDSTKYGTARGQQSKEQCNRTLLQKIIAADEYSCTRRSRY